MKNYKTFASFSVKDLGEAKAFYTGSLFLSSEPVRSKIMTKCALFRTWHVTVAFILNRHSC